MEDCVISFATDLKLSSVVYCLRKLIQNSMEMRQDACSKLFSMSTWFSMMSGLIFYENLLHFNVNKTSLVFARKKPLYRVKLRHILDTPKTPPFSVLLLCSNHRSTNKCNINISLIWAQNVMSLQTSRKDWFLPECK